MYTERTNPLLHFSVDELFGDKASVDNSLVATLRYIAIKHCDGDFSKLKSSFKVLTRYSDSNWSESSFAEDIGMLQEGAFCLYLPSNNKQTLPHQLAVDGWKRLNAAPYPIEQYLSKHTGTIVLTNENKKSVAIVIEKSTPEIYNAIQSIMFRIWNWYYPTKNISEDETALFKAISKEDEDKYISLCQALANQYDFEWLYYQSKLRGWNNKFLDRQLTNVKQKMESHLRDIESYNQSLDNAIRNYNSVKTIYDALAGTRQEANDEIAQFFAQRRNYMHIVSINNDSCVFNIVETIEFYDEEAFSRLYKNRASCLYAGGSEIAKALKGIFIDGIGKFQVESTFSLAGLVTLEPQVYDNPYQKNTALHPHLCRYRCLGGNEKYIREYLQTGQWGQAIDQAVAATKNINFGDATVIEYFVRYLKTKINQKFIVSNDGTLISIQDVLAIINKQEEVNNG